MRELVVAVAALSAVACTPDTPASGSEDEALTDATICGVADEGSSTQLSCPAGQTISSITYASYGLPGGSCGSFATGSCHAATSLSVVKSACVGKPSCTVAATNATFGDPCRGADKRLAVQAVCSGGTTTPPDGYFPSSAIWSTDISTAPRDSESSAVIAWLDRQGWGTGQMQIDFSIEVLRADASVTPRSFTRTSDWFSPDCDSGPVPVPPGGALEGESGYACLSDGDCHLIVKQGTKLYEMWRADLRNGTFRGGCLATWDLTRVYTPSGRGDGCTSADAAGYPIAPLLFTADEVAAGEIKHAIRFILPNARIRKGVYVHPATHGTGATSGPSTAPPYGARLRLRADFPMSRLPNKAARTVARAMQRYGILLADGGNIALTAQSDRSTTKKWAGLLAPRDLAAIRPSDFDMIAGGPRYPITADCTRTP